MSPFVSHYLAPVVSQPRRLSQLSGVEGFICLPLSPFICLPLSPAWMPGTALWVDGFICHPLSPFICLPLPPSLDAWHCSLGGRVHLSPFVSRFYLSGTALWALFPFICLPLSPSLDVWHGSPGGQIHLSPFICLPLSPSLDAWHGSLGGQFPCLPLSPFIWLPLSPSLDVCHGFPGGRIHLSPLVPLHLSPISVGGRIDLSPFLCLPLFVSRCLPAWMPLWWTDSFVSLCLPLFVSRCLPAWMPLWVDGFICLPLSPSLDAWHSRSAVSFTSRGSVLLAGSGLPSASALASVIPCLVDVGDRVLCLPFIWTSILLGLVVGRLPCLSLATPCLFVQCLVISCGLSLSLLAFGVPS